MARRARQKGGKMNTKVAAGLAVLALSALPSAALSAIDPTAPNWTRGDYRPAPAAAPLPGADDSFPMPYAVHRRTKHYEDGSVTVKVTGYFHTATLTRLTKKLAIGATYAVLGTDNRPPHCVMLIPGEDAGCTSLSYDDPTDKGSITITHRRATTFQFWATYSYCRLGGLCRTQGR